jgi:DNA-binding CsgD family transcriptional regulator
VRSNDKLLAMVGAIYDAAIDDAGWTATLERLSDMLGGSPTVIISQDSTGCITFSNAVRSDPGCQGAYVDHFQFKDPTRPHSITAPAGVYTVPMVVDKSAFLRSEFYNDFARPNGMHGLIRGVAFRDATGSGLITATTSERQGDLESELVQIMETLLTHFGRALRVRMRLNSATLRSEMTAGALDQVPHAMLLVDAAAHVLFANRAAERLLSRCDGLGIDADGLCTARRADTVALRHRIAVAAGRIGDSAAGGALQVPRPSGRRPLAVLVSPLRPAAAPAWMPLARPAALLLVTEQDQQPATGQAGALYDLTPAEAAFAAVIARGGGVKAAACALGVAPSTARTHLHRIFVKTGTSGQAELAALLARTP